MLNIVKAACRLFLAFLAVIFASCSSNQERTPVEKLERPPQMVNYTTDDHQDRFADSVPQGDGGEAQEEEKKPNQNVRLMTVSGSDTKLEILEPFDQAWVLVAKAMKYDSAFEVTDRNRDEGIFYVSYSPDKHNKSLLNSTLSFFTGGSESEGDYYLRLVESGPKSEVTAEMVVEEEFDDEGDSIADPEVGVEKFLTALYKVLQEI